MTKSLHFRLAATMIAGLLAVALVCNGAYLLELGSLAKETRLALETSLAGQTGAAKAAAEAEKIIGASISSALTMAVSLSLAALLAMAGILALIMRKNLLTPLEVLAGFARKVAAGDLAAKADGEFIGRLGVLKDALESMVDNLKEGIASSRKTAENAEHNAVEAEKAARQAERAHKKDEIRRQGMLGAGETLENVAETIQSATSELKTDAREVSDGAEEQKGLIDETAQAMDEMLTSIMGVAESATQAADASEEAGGKAKTGADVVNNSVEAIGRVSRLAEALKAEMADLGAQAESIGQVMTVISDIADQTNLLALNAAIEAARAGEAGRGFAVVADEVRKLAEKTMSATSEVGRVIQAIQKSARDNIKNMDEAAEAVDTATSLAGQSRDALGEIVSLSDTASARVRAIADSSKDQAESSERIKQAIDRIHEVSARTTEGMLRSTETIERLGGEIEELIKLNGVFKLIGQGTAQDLVESLAAAPDILSLEQKRMEDSMKRAISEHSFLELLYATDAHGLQITENIAPAAFRSKSAQSVRGRNWSSRPWYKGVAANNDTYISPIYLSEASGEYCLTISTPIFQDEHFAGVLAADIKVFT